jgi:hypothetical protein
MTKSGASIEIYNGADSGIEHSENTKPVIADGPDTDALELLQNAHDVYGYTTQQEEDDIKRLREEIAVRQTELDALKSKKVTRRKMSEYASYSNAEYLRDRLEDPDSSFHPVFRSVLLNTEQAGGSLSNRQTHAEAIRLGEALVRFTHYIETSETPEPLVVVRNIPTVDKPIPNLQLDFGYTHPTSGVKLFNMEDGIVSHSNISSDTAPQPWLSVDTIENPPMHAVMQSGENSHFVWDSERVTKVDGIEMLDDIISVNDAVPQVGNVQLPLPIGNLYAPRSEKAFIIHDNPNNGIEEIILPGNFQEIKRDTLIIVGGKAIQNVFGILPSRVQEILGEEKGMVAQAMTFAVAHEILGLQIENSL